MKWTYLPFIVFLAFSYTKWSVGDPFEKIKKKESLTKRSPATLIKPPRSFEFVDLELKENPSFKKIAEFRGAIVGNTKADSFGFVRTDKNKILFSIINFSEVTDGPYMDDVMGHFFSAKGQSENIQWFNYFEAYKEGLLGNKREHSYHLEKGQGEYAAKMEEIVEKNMTETPPFHFLNTKNMSIEKKIKEEIKQEFKKKFPSSEIYDIATMPERKKAYHLLVRLRPQEKIKWLELSEVQGDFFEKKINILKTIIFNDEMDKSINAIRINKKEYITKSMEQFSSPFFFEALSADDFEEIIFDEAYLLGKIHGRTLLEKRAEYVKAWAKIPGKFIEKKHQDLKFKAND